MKSVSVCDILFSVNWKYEDNLFNEKKNSGVKNAMVILCEITNLFYENIVKDKNCYQFNLVSSQFWEINH